MVRRDLSPAEYSLYFNVAISSRLSLSPRSRSTLSSNFSTLSPIPLQLLHHPRYPLPSSPLPHSPLSQYYPLHKFSPNCRHIPPLTRPHPHRPPPPSPEHILLTLVTRNHLNIAYFHTRLPLYTIYTLSNQAPHIAP
ncbi:hypothetical protein CC80DRAFT_198528 [Byssothecium circinans]|uniref:Uncharacterized protein n=1 Tax=Byssothecium circinans TaxID=147558 RepID=A0A6A5UD04_9PLEO|nr:hypothetical protein CC80DRAFT_198528 [Byssothecium circinans]